MRKLLQTAYIYAISFSVIVLASSVSFAHGPAAETGSSDMMTRMMEMMHGSMDQNRALNCKSVSDAELMEQGERMMEQMMGREDHERIEEAMEKDMSDPLPSAKFFSGLI